MSLDLHALLVGSVFGSQIARGEIKPLEDLKAQDFDALAFPGGFGLHASSVPLPKKKGVELMSFQLSFLDDSRN